MGKLEPIEGKSTSWEGLWWHPEYNGFSSSVIDLADLRKFKGKVRLYVRKNRFFNRGENNRPNYLFCLRDADSEVFKLLEVIDDEDCEDEDWQERHAQLEGEVWYTGSGDRLYTRDEVRKIINGTFDDVCYGFSDPYDILPEDFV